MVRNSQWVLQATDAIATRGQGANWWLFAALQARGVHCCVRIDACGWPDVARRLRSSAQEIVVRHQLRADVRRAVQALDLVYPEEIVLRLVKVCLPCGRLQVLATSLTDAQRYSAAAFSALYGQRLAIKKGLQDHQAPLARRGLQW